MTSKSSAARSGSVREKKKRVGRRKKAAPSKKASSARATGKTTKSKSAKKAAKQPKVTKTQIEDQAAKYRSKASAYRNDPKKTEKLLRDAEAKARKNPGPISGRLQDLATLMRLIRAYMRKDYRDIPWETIALAIGAVVYFVSPIDLIPDFIPVAGYVDDAALIGFVIASAANELHNFREWEAQQQFT